MPYAVQMMAQLPTAIAQHTSRTAADFVMRVVNARPSTGHGCGSHARASNATAADATNSGPLNFTLSATPHSSASASTLNTVARRPTRHVVIASAVATSAAATSFFTSGPCASNVGSSASNTAVAIA